MNVPLFSQQTIFKNDTLSNMIPEGIPGIHYIDHCNYSGSDQQNLLDLYLETKSGYLLRAVGDNPDAGYISCKGSGNVKMWDLQLPGLVTGGQRVLGRARI